jgi:iron complex outermembrane recepter protein
MVWTVVMSGKLYSLFQGGSMDQDGIRTRSRISGVGMRGCAIAILLGSPVWAAAQQAGPVGQTEEAAEDREVVTLGELLVTVRKVDERAQDVPLSLVVLNRSRIFHEGLRQTEDLARRVPGFTFDRGPFPNDTRPAMRGIQSERGRPSVAVLLDGHDLSSANLGIPGGTGALHLSLHDLERIEVVKGPQSILFGRNAFAGAVNYITAAPAFDFGGRAGVEMGAFGRNEYTVSATGPLVGNKLAFRLNAVRGRDDGSYTNPLTSSPLGAKESSGVALGLLYRPTSNLTVSGRVQYMDRDETESPMAFVSSNVRLQVPGTQTTRASFEGPIRAGVQDVQMGLDPLTGQPWAGMDMTYRIATWKAEWRTFGGEVTYLGSLLKNESRINQDGDFTDFSVTDPMAFAISSISRWDQNADQQNHELRWTRRTDLNHWIAGVQRYQEDMGMNNESQFWLRNPQSFLSGPPFRLKTAPISDLKHPAYTSRETAHWGVFAGYGREVTDRVRVSVEARYNAEDVNYFTSGWKLEDITLFGLVPGCDASRAQGATLSPGVVNACAQTANHKSQQITPRASAEYRFRDDVMGYLSFARGYKPGGYETLEVASFEGRQYRPEHLNAYEAGLKSTWLKDRLILNGSTFYNDYTDQQISHQQIDPNTGFAVPRVGNAGKVRAQGFELGTDWRVPVGVSAGLSYAYTDAVFKSYILGPAAPAAGVTGAAFDAVFLACGVPVGQTSTPLPRAEAGNDCGDFSGNEVGRSPKHALHGNVMLRQALGSQGNHWFAEASTQYMSERFTDESNRAWLPAYSLTDFQVGVEGARWTLTAFVKNAFDSDAIQTAQRNVDFGRPDGFAPGRAFNAYLPQPRHLGLRVSANLW